MNSYNYKRTNQGKHCRGRTPAQMLEAGYENYKKFVFTKKEVTEISADTN